MKFLADPVVALFLSLALGFLIGKVKLGPVQIGGVCGTLFVALLLGQLGITVSADLKDLAFALFIYALGYTAGPQFFSNIRDGWRFGIFPIIEVSVAMAIVLLVVWFFQFDPGTAAGIFAGSATESAVVGTASDAISHLSISQDQMKQWQSNIATAYSLTYLFGLISIVVFVSQIAPLILKANLREEASKLAGELGSDSQEYESSLPIYVERAFEAGPASGKSVAEIEKSLDWGVAIGGIHRNGEVVEAKLETIVQPGDVVFLRGRRNWVIEAKKAFGEEARLPEEAGMKVISRDVIFNRKDLDGGNLENLREIAPPELRRGVLVTNINRMGNDLAPYPKTTLQHGDILTLYGPQELVEWAIKEVGEEAPDDKKVDYVFLGLGLVFGLFIGSLSWKILGIDLHLGKGGGALIAGIIFGWVASRISGHGSFPEPVSHFAKDFGLAIFIAAIGLQAGPSAFSMIQQYGLVLPVIGIIVSVVPAMVSLYVGHRFMKIKLPILLGAIAGQHCSTPTVSALVEEANNSTPIIGYTVTYAIANVILPLMGPIIVAVV